MRLEHNILSIRLHADSSVSFLPVDDGNLPLLLIFCGAFCDV